MTGYESPRIPIGGEHPYGWKHPDINDAFSPLDVTNAVNQAQQYWQVRNLWDQGLRTFERSIRTSLEQAWSGPAADKAMEQIQDYTRKADELTPILAELYTRVRDAADAIVNTKKALPDPVVVTWTSWLWPPNRWELQREQSSEEQAAQVAMETHYVKPFADIDGKIPVLPTPVSPTSSLDIPPPPPGGYNGGPGPGPGGPGPGPGSGVPGDIDGDGVPDTPVEEPTDEETPEDTTTDDTSTNPTSTTTTPTTQTPTSTTPAGLNPTDPNRTVPSGLPSGPGSPGGPGPGTPGVPGTPPGMGRSIQGVPTTPGTQGPVGGLAAASNANSRGMAGMPGMGAPGARGGGKDDEEHKLPEYLVTQENTDELLGEIPKTIPGGVIGGDLD
ncbi:hypothetical protein APR11_004656 [Nocardia amikacinitolerans]|uniref:hypothetical protein n=1 Tax=Nocardia amikacinitolerans TaxID=756689 RepID=UPI0020A2B42B|nr:hypothetical protein [Nocardia amikacinitolerans]MCP2298215.1 hypothetical protein [Nocardia amikacinitolerans]